jgi:outer membrane protein
MIKTSFIAVVSAVIGSILSLTLVGQAQPARTPSAVAYISGNRIAQESAWGRGETSKLQTFQQQKLSELRTKQQTLEATRQQMAQATDPAARMQLLQQEQQQRTDFERSQQQAQVEIQTLQRQMNANVLQRVKTTLDDLMKTQTYQLVLNGDTCTVWSTPEVDLTSAVVARFNAQQ